MNDRILAALAVAALMIGVGVATAAARTDDEDDRMTICHKPDGQARTMEVSRSAWSAHRDHGDHEGACGGHDARAGAGTNGDDSDAGDEAPEPRPLAHVTVSAQSEGDVDGEAVFELTLRNTGEGDADGVRLTGRLHGDGDWRVRSRDADCRVEGRELTCALDALEAGATASVRLHYDAGVRVCHEPSIRVSVEAGNDDDADDDRTSAETRVGVCALERPPD